MASNGFTVKSSLSPGDAGIAQAMFDIFKSDLASGQSAYPGSAASAAFSPRNVQSNFRSNVARPLNNLYRDNFASLIGPSAQPFAQGRRQETIGALGAQAGYVGERQAYQEYLRTLPQNSLNLGQALLSTNTSAAYTPENEFAQWANLGLTAIGAAGQAYGASQLNNVPDTSAWQGGAGVPFSPYQIDRSSFGRTARASSDFQFDTAGPGF